MRPPCHFIVICVCTLGMGVNMDFHHIPVLLDECISGLNIKPDGIYVDGTAGGAGHSIEIAKRLTTGRLIALDKDPTAAAAATERLKEYPAMVVQSDFRGIAVVLDKLQIPEVNGILLDLGVSSYQLDNAERGFSYHNDAPLDMRMTGEGFSAKDLLATYSINDMTRVFRDYGEEKFAYKIACNIDAARKTKPLETSAELVEIIKASIPAPARREGGHPAKRVFQAIRIAVNSELDALSECIVSAFPRLKSGGRFAIITFHSLEDRIVKQSFSKLASGCTCPPDFPVCVCGKKPQARLVNKKPVTASPEELEKNSRSKPAKLRVLEKII